LICDSYADVVGGLMPGFTRVSSVEQHLSDMQELGSNRVKLRQLKEAKKHSSNDNVSNTQMDNPLYDFMLKKPYRNQNIINLLQWIQPRVLKNISKNKHQLRPVIEISSPTRV